MAWATTGEVLQAIADAANRDVGDLPAKLSRQVAQAVRKARGQISRALGARGITAAQIEAWGDLQEFSFDQSLFNAEVYLRQMFQDRLGQMMQLKDRTAELADVAVLDAGGVPIVVGGVSSGVLNVRAEFDRRVECERRRYGRQWGGQDYRW